MLHAIKASIPKRPLDTRGVAAEIDCLEAAYVSPAHPTGKDSGVNAFRVVSSAQRAEEIPPLFVSSLWRPGEFVPGVHHDLQLDAISDRQCCATRTTSKR